MLATLNMKTLTSRVDARRLMYGNGPRCRDYNGYRAWTGYWQFSSATTLRFVDFDGLSQDNTMGAPKYTIPDGCPSEGQGIDINSPEG